MTPHAANRLAKANGFLEELRQVSPEAAPAATIHLAYYAMLHAAAAVLLNRTGDAPKTHTSTVRQFSLQVLNDGEQGRKFGRAFSKAEKLRMVSDYDENVTPTAADAVELHSMAIEFVAYCRALL